MKIRGIVAAVFALAFVSVLGGKAFAGAAEGETVFQAKCKACHSTSDKKVLGPGLAGVMKLHSPEWMHKWLMNPQAVWEANDAETAAMKERVKNTGAKTKMKIKGGGLPENEANDIVEYLKTL